MTLPTDEKRRALGIDPDVAPRRIGRDLPADDHVGRGWSSAPDGSLTVADLRRRFASRTEVASFEEAAAGIGAPEASVARADRHPDLFQLSLPGLAVDAAGDVRALDDVWYVDARAGEALVRARGLAGDLLLRFEGTVFEWYDLPTAASAAMRSLADWSPPDAPAVDAPAADALLGGFDAPAWMTAPLARAPREDPYAVCAAVGTLGRLWAPRGTATPPADALARLMDDDDPMARARHWFAALPQDTRDVVDDLARAEAASLADALDALATAAEDDRDLAREDAARWLERRDGLASIVRLRRHAPDGALAQSLFALDRRAATLTTLWRLLAPIRTPRLDAVAWQEPDAWWAEPARDP
jgi:hypothetical protein